MTTPSPALGPVLDLGRAHQDGFTRARIPALTRTAAGTLIAVFDAREDLQDLPAHIRLVLRRSTDDGRTWGPIQPLHGDVEGIIGDPSLLVDHETGRVLCFAAGGVCAGFHNSRTGTDEHDPMVQQVELLISDDDGITWRHRRITAQVKDPRFTGCFPSSGEGIQLRHGPHKGRLLQQLVLKGEDGNRALTAYSDDHGETWQHGQPVGPGADENKVVERHDGSVLLNTRTHGERRAQAVSTDGGLTYTALAPVPEQVDPGNNGSIIRPFPEAEPAHPLARLMVLSNALHPTMRKNLTLSYSLDDGATWTSRDLVEAEAAEYSTLTRIDDATLGLAYEREGYNTMSFRRVDLRALSISPLLLSLEGEPVLRSGGIGTVQVQATNQGAAPVLGARLSVQGPDGIRGERVSIEPLDPGESRSIALPVQVPAGLGGPRRLTLTAEVELEQPVVPDGLTQVRSTRDAEVMIVAPADAHHASLEITTAFDAAYTQPGSTSYVGDDVFSWATLRNSGDVPLHDIVVRAAVGTDGARIERLDPGATTRVAWSPALAVPITEEDVRRGAWTTLLVAEGHAPDGTVVREAAPISPVDLSDRQAHRLPSPLRVPTGDLRSSALPTGEALAVPVPDGHPLALSVLHGGTAAFALELADAAHLEIEGPGCWEIEAGPDGRVRGKVTADETAPVGCHEVQLLARTADGSVRIPLRLQVHATDLSAVRPAAEDQKIVAALAAPTYGEQEAALLTAARTTDPDLAARARHLLHLAVRAEDGPRRWGTLVRVREELLAALDDTPACSHGTPVDAMEPQQRG